MKPERFKALAEAYGGDISRWPASEREAGLAFLTAHPDASSALSEQAALDDFLVRWEVPGPGAALAGRIASTLGRSQLRARRLLLWFSGLGAAAALAGGAAAGMIVVSLSSPPTDQATGRLYELTVLGAPLDIAEPPASSDHS